MADSVIRSLFRQASAGFTNSFRQTFCIWMVMASTAWAQSSDPREEVDSPGLVIEATIGWDGILDQSTPVPVSFLIHNNTDRNIEGTLTLSDLLTGKAVSLGEIVISPGTTRRQTSIQSMRNWYDCVGRLNHRGKILWRRELGQLGGRRIDNSVNHVMFVDGNGRNLPLPGALSASDATTIQDTEIAGRQGRPFRRVDVKPWQLPNHPGPLAVIDGMVFPEGTIEKDLNRVQWKAVAEWICQGGTLFVHDKSRDVVDRILELAPLRTEPAAQSGSFTVRRLGLGSIYEYAPTLMTPQSDEIRQSIATIATRLKRNLINTFADSGDLHETNERSANKNRFMVGVFFVIYTLLTSVVAFVLFRLSQKQIAYYTVFVVVAASIFSALLGGYLRLSPGDLNWVTVTQAGIGGLVQVGSVEVQSAGSRNTRVAVKGEHVDLQAITMERNRYYYYGYGSHLRRGYSPFVWQPNQAMRPEASYQINVPMTLWGRRRCHATAFKADTRALDFELAFESHQPEPTAPQKQRDTPQGVISLNLTNRMTFDVHDCWLVVGITHPSSPQLRYQENAQRNNYNPWSKRRQPASPIDDKLIDIYHLQRLGKLEAGATREEKIAANFQVMENNGELMMSWPSGSQIPPRISQIGVSSAWIIGRIANSPIMEIDERNSDFISQSQVHLFVQEILSEDMPETLRFKE